MGAAAWRRHGRVGVGRPVPLLITAVAALALAGATALYLAVDVLRHRELEVAFDSGDITLTGTVYLPSGREPHPGVVLVHGSSPGTRGIFRPFGNALVRRGLAVLSYDKRGFGGSDGALPYTYEQLADDAAAAVEWLGRRGEVDAAKVGLMGFSEGGWTAPLAASRTDSVAFLVVVSGGALTPAEQELWEMRNRLEDAGFGARAVQEAVALQRSLQDYYRTGAEGDRVLASVRRAAGEAWFETAFELQPRDIAASLDEVGYTHDPTELDFDALPVLKELHVPELFIFGGADRLVPARRSAQAIRSALNQDLASGFRVVIFPGADHLLLEWPLDPVPWPRFAPGLMDTVAAWIEGITEAATYRPG